MRDTSEKKGSDDTGMLPPSAPSVCDSPPLSSETSFTQRNLMPVTHIRRREEVPFLHAPPSGEINFRSCLSHSILMSAVLFFLHLPAYSFHPSFFPSFTRSHSSSPRISRPAKASVSLGERLCILLSDNIATTIDSHTRRSEAMAPMPHDHHHPVLCDATCHCHSSPSPANSY